MSDAEEGTANGVQDPEGSSPVKIIPCSEEMNDRSNSQNAIIQPLLTDLYQITMAYAYWKANRIDDRAVFDLFFRKSPFSGEFTIFAGLSECIKFLENFHYSESGKRERLAMVTLTFMLQCSSCRHQVLEDHSAIQRRG